MGDAAKGFIGLLVIGAIIYGATDSHQGSDSSGGSGGSDSSGGSSAALSGSSTCDEWNAAAFQDQVDLSQAIIDKLNAYDTSNDYAVRFANDITTGCEPVGSITVATVAGTIATMATADFPPQ